MKMTKKTPYPKAPKINWVILQGKFTKVKAINSPYYKLFENTY